MQTDYIIVGQGLCGTLLSYELMKAGKQVIVIDESNPFTAGKVASGLINPVTGKRVVKSWMIDNLLTAAISTYKELETRLGVTIIHPWDILEFHPDAQHRDIFTERTPQYAAYLRIDIEENAWKETFNFNYGIGGVTQTMIINIRLLQDEWRKNLISNDSLLEERFDMEQCTITTNKVTYKNISAERIIFCDGSAGLSNPYFARLPFALNKGEVLIAEIPDLPRHYVYKNGLKIAPWEDDKFWIGSSFEWTFENTLPSTKFREKTEWQLRNWLKLPYTITDHWASVRPATVDHKPFVGFHPGHTSVGIFNGMGAKGCSQVPYFAHQLAAHITNQEPIMPDADIQRFTRILSKQ